MHKGLNGLITLLTVITEGLGKGMLVIEQEAVFLAPGDRVQYKANAPQKGATFA